MRVEDKTLRHADTCELGREKGADINKETESIIEEHSAKQC